MGSLAAEAHVVAEVFQAAGRVVVRVAAVVVGRMLLVVVEAAVVEAAVVRPVVEAITRRWDLHPANPCLKNETWGTRFGWVVTKTASPIHDGGLCVAMNGRWVV